MTTQGVIVLNVIGVLLLVWLFNLIRQARLYVGYGIIFIIAIVATMITVSVPSILMFVTRLVGAFFPASAMTMLAIGFIVFALIYILTQLTIISNRVSNLVQELAIRQAEGGKQNPKDRIEARRTGESDEDGEVSA